MGHDPAERRAGIDPAIRIGVGELIIHELTLGKAKGPRVAA